MLRGRRAHTGVCAPGWSHRCANFRIQTPTADSRRPGGARPSAVHLSVGADYILSDSQEAGTHCHLVCELHPPCWGLGCPSPLSDRVVTVPPSFRWGASPALRRARGTDRPDGVSRQFDSVARPRPPKSTAVSLGGCPPYRTNSNTVIRVVKYHQINYN